MEWADGTPSRRLLSQYSYISFSSLWPVNIPRAKWALVIAGLYSLGIIVAGFFVPMYSSLSVTSTGKVTHGSATLVAENGLNIVFVLSVPLILTFAIWTALRLHTRRGAMALAWTLAGSLALFNLVAMMTIGLFIVPVTICLLYACSRFSRTSFAQASDI